MILFLLLMPLLTFATIPTHWSHLISVSEKHEFYQEGELIKKPADTWQLLFAVSYLDRKLSMHRDCVYFKVPGESLGILKLIATELESCEGLAENKGTIELKEIKGLQYSIKNEEIKIHITYPDFKSVKWTMPLLNRYQVPVAKLFLSSAEYKAAKITMLAPLRVKSPRQESRLLKKGTLCHDIDDSCQEASPSVCKQCEGAWYEIPNGCEHGPKYCGDQGCGGKNQPACRRGLKYQRVNKIFDCATDSSFAYCSKGLTLQCEGQRAFCR
jgi:hypothetical protein